jgi:GTPase SAR1 family protein
VCKILIGNKCDLKDREVLYDEGKNLAETYGIKFYETSAKENKNIDECFT